MNNKKRLAIFSLSISLFAFLFACFLYSNKISKNEKYLCDYYFSYKNDKMETNYHFKVIALKTQIGVLIGNSNEVLQIKIYDPDENIIKEHKVTYSDTIEACWMHNSLDGPIINLVLDIGYRKGTRAFLPRYIVKYSLDRNFKLSKLDMVNIEEESEYYSKLLKYEFKHTVQ